MQGNLFSPAVEMKETAILCLNKFQFKKAGELFREASEIDPFLAELESYLVIAKFLGNRFDEGNPQVEPALIALAQIRADWEKKRQSQFVFDFIENHLSRFLLSQVSEDFNDYISYQQIEFHVGYFLYTLKDYSLARKKLLEYVTTPTGRFHANLWGYLGDVNYLLKFYREAEKSYSSAFFINPFQVDMMKLKHPEIIEKFKHALEKFKSEALALQYLPILCWMNRLLSIPSGQSFLTDYAESKLAQRFEKHQKYHRFALCLLIDQSGVREEMDFRAREEMQKIDVNLFQEYLDRIDPY